MSAALRQAFSGQPVAWLQLAWTWWAGELRALLPHSIRHAFGVHGEPTARLLFSKAGAGQVSDRDQARSQTIQLPQTADLHALEAPVAAGTIVRVQLAPDLALITGLILPETAAGSLSPIVLHQLEKLVPLDPSLVVHGYRLSGRSEACKTLAVTVAIVKRSSIEEVLQTAARRGLTVQDIVVPTPDTPTAPPLVVWQASAGKSMSIRWRQVRGAMVVLGCACLLLAYGLHFRQLQAIKEELQTDLAAARHSAQAANTVSEEARKLSAALQFLQARRAEATPLRIIAELTQTIPRDSWVNQLSLRGRAVEVMGYSPRAADLIGHLEQSQLLGNPRFRSAITMAPDGRGERFHLSLELRQGAGP